MSSLYILPCLLALVAFSQATNVHFENHCGNSIQVIRTENGQAPAVECDLGPGESPLFSHLPLQGQAATAATAPTE